jgi:hypothetical protein
MRMFALFWNHGTPPDSCEVVELGTARIIPRNRGGEKPSLT